MTTTTTNKRGGVSVVDINALDRDLKARVLHSTATRLGDAAYAKTPAQVLPDVAHRASLTVDVVRAIVQAHGWPRPESMRRAAQALLDGNHTTTTSRAVNDYAEQTLELVAVEQLHPDPNNIREDLGNLDELAASIRDVGILQPIVARTENGKLVIVMGHRRHAAAQLAGLHQVPVVIRPGHMDPDDVLAAMIVENGQRLDLDPIEEARALARLKRTDKMSDTLLADRISKSHTYVSGRLALLSLTPPQQAAVRAGTLSLARAAKLGREQGGTSQPKPEHTSTAHLCWAHPLADKAAVLCEREGHHKNRPGRPGGVACGACWEQVIRADERDNPSQES